MRFLLDVNSLIAFGLGHHVFRDRVFRWVDSERTSTFLTCSITELGFIRIISQPSGYGFTLNDAKDLLLQMKSNPDLPLSFLDDDQDVSALPTWVKIPAQSTDGHLVQLAGAHNAVLATLDTNIPGAFQIP